MGISQFPASSRTGLEASSWDEHEAAFLAEANPQIRLAFMLAIWTGQRQGDIIRLPWGSYTGTHIKLRQNKSKRHILVLVGAPLKALLDATPRRAPQIVLNEDGQPYTSSGFRSTFRKTQARAGLQSVVTFHDIRGTTVTRLAELGCTEIEIASITGHSLKEVQSILDKHYLSRTQRLGETAIRRLEKRTKAPD